MPFASVTNCIVKGNITQCSGVSIPGYKETGLYSLKNSDKRNNTQTHGGTFDLLSNDQSESIKDYSHNNNNNTEPKTLHSKQVHKKNNKLNKMGTQQVFGCTQFNKRGVRFLPLPLRPNVLEQGPVDDRLLQRGSGLSQNGVYKKTSQDSSSLMQVVSGLLSSVHFQYEVLLF